MREYVEKEKQKFQDLDLTDRTELKQKYENMLNPYLDSLNSYISANCNSFSYQIIWNDIDSNIQNRSDKVGEDKYVIELFLFVPYIFERYLKEQKNLSEKNTDTIITNILVNSLYHEFFHIAFGHCTIPEDIKIPDKIRCMFEVMCDKSALKLLTDNFDLFFAIEKKKNGFESAFSNFVQTYATIISCMVIQYTCLEDLELYKMEKNIEDDIINKRNKLPEKKKYLTYTSNDRNHPFVVFRFDYLLELIENRLREHELNEEQLKFLFDKVDVFLIEFGFPKKFCINPYTRRNRKKIKEFYDVDFDTMFKYVKKCYIKNLVAG